MKAAIYYGVQGGSKFESKVKSCSVTIPLKNIEQYLTVKLFIKIIICCRRQLSLLSLDEILQCGHSNESY